MNGHLTVTVELKAGIADIDSGVADLVKVIDGIDGIMTAHSCQGGPELDGSDGEHGYVSFVASGSPQPCINFLTVMAGRMADAHLQKAFPWRDGYDDQTGGYFKIELNAHAFTIRWDPWVPEVYPCVLAAARAAARSVVGHGHL